MWLRRLEGMYRSARERIGYRQASYAAGVGCASGITKKISLISRQLPGHFGRQLLTETDKKNDFLSLKIYHLTKDQYCVPNALFDISGERARIYN